MFVETELFQGASQRYEPNLRMTKLPEIRFDRVKGTVKTIMPVHVRCRLHRLLFPPRETLNVRPTIADYPNPDPCEYFAADNVLGWLLMR